MMTRFSLILLALLLIAPTALPALDLAVREATLDQILATLRDRHGLMVVSSVAPPREGETPRKVTLRLDGVAPEAAVNEVAKAFDAPWSRQGDAYLIGGGTSGSVLLALTVELPDGTTSATELVQVGRTFEVRLGSGRVRATPLLIGR